MPKLLQLFLLLVVFSQPVFAESSTSESDASATKTLLWPDGTRYVGGVKEGKRSGKGTIFWQDGTRFVGTFVDDQRNGPGTMILPDGTVYNGYFENDTLVERSESVAQSEPTAPVAGISAEDLATISSPGIAEADASLVTATQVPSPEIETAQAITPPAEPTSSTPTADAVTETVTIAETLTAPASLTPEMRMQVQAAIDLWAAAWSDQNVEQYLGAYAADFAVPGRQSRRQWEGLRRSRLTRPSRIEVSINYETFELIAANEVQVDFNQIYDSNLFSDKTRKRLLLKKVDELWKIVSEESR